MKTGKFLKDRRDEFTPGDWNIIDDRSGRKRKASQTEKQWDGMRTVRPNERNPQDFLRATPEHRTVPWTRIDDTTTYVNSAPKLVGLIDSSAWTLSGGSSSSWEIVASHGGVAIYTAGSTDTIYQEIGAVSTGVYELTYDLYAVSGGASVTPTIGAGSGTARTSGGHYVEEITASGANVGRLTFTPNGSGSLRIENIRIRRVS